MLLWKAFPVLSLTKYTLILCLGLWLGFSWEAGAAREKTPRLLRFSASVAEVDTIRFDGGEVTVRFECENISDKAVTILDVHPQCGCTTPVFPRTSIAPGKTAVVEVTLHPESLFGEQKRHLTVVATNGDYRKFSTLTVHGYVQRDQTEAEIRFPVLLGEGLRTELETVGLRRRKAGEKVQRTLVFYNDAPEERTLSFKSGLRVSGDLSVRRLPSGSRTTVEISYNTRWMRKGAFTDSICCYVDGIEVAPIKLSGTIE